MFFSSLLGTPIVSLCPLDSVLTELKRFLVSKALTSVHPKTMFSDVILRSPANGGATKNLMVEAVSRDSSLRSE